MLKVEDSTVILSTYHLDLAVVNIFPRLLASSGLVGWFVFFSSHAGNLKQRDISVL